MVSRCAYPRFLPRDPQHLPQPFRFLDLPPGLRNIIYKMIIAEKTYILGRPNSLPAILKTNKQVHNESIVLYYSTATFAFNFDDLEKTVRIYRKLPRHLSNSITALRYCFKYDSEYAKSAAMSVRRARKLAKSTRMGCRKWMIHAPFKKEIIHVGIKKPGGGAEEVVWTNVPEGLVKKLGW